MKNIYKKQREREIERVIIIIFNISGDDNIGVLVKKMGVYEKNGAILWYTIYGNISLVIPLSIYWVYSPKNGIYGSPFNILTIFSIEKIVEPLRHKGFRQFFQKGIFNKKIDKFF